MRLSQRVHATLTTAATLAIITAGSGAIASQNSDLTSSDNPPTLAGSYLAGRSADIAIDIPSAIRFYDDALVGDPTNPALTERILLLNLAAGNMDAAFKVADQLITLDSGNPAARLSLAVEAIKQNHPDDALSNLDAIGHAELASLTAGLVGAWVDFGAGKVDDAVARIAALKGPDWYAVFKSYHTALILDAAGREPEAADAIAAAYKIDATALRVVDGYARIMVRAGKRDEAIRALVQFAGSTPPHPLLRDLLADIQGGKTPPPTAATTAAGVAEALYGLGSAIGVDDGPELPAGYLQLAAYLDPVNYLATMAIGDVWQSVQRYDDAIAVYDTVPATASLRRNADIEIGTCLLAENKPEEAIRYIKRVADSDSTDVQAAIELGNVYRASNKFTEAAAAYSRGIAQITKPDKSDWQIYYYRGVSLEQAKHWPEAEADFLKALSIDSEQPQVLNYLGYSWVDRGINLDRALGMIQKAVNLRPNDGYIVDSLGWAYYRLGRAKQAVSSLEAAVLLRPDDSTINDHLGDAYWRAGEKRDAYFQWTHAKDFGPDKEEMPKIMAKLEHGLPAADATTNPNAVQVGHGDSLWTIAQRLYGDGKQYDRILRANKSLIGNPDRIFPGMTLDLPESTTD